MEILYRDCQRFATDEIGKLVAEVNLEFVWSKTVKSKDWPRSLRGLFGVCSFVFEEVPEIGITPKLP